MGSVRIKKGCHVKYDGNINFVGVRGMVGVANSGGGEKGAVFTCCAMLIFTTSSASGQGKQGETTWTCEIRAGMGVRV
jgi:hypothetical protein